MKGFFLSKGEEKELAESYLIPQSSISRALKQDPSWVLLLCFIPGQCDGRKGDSSGSRQGSSWKADRDTAGLDTDERVSTLSPVETLGSKDSWSERGAWSRAGPTEPKLQA